MRAETFRLAREDGAQIHVYRWSPDGAPRAAIQIAHGLAEHAGALRAAGRGADRGRLRRLRERPSGPRHDRRARRISASSPTSGGWAQGSRRSLGAQPANRQGSAARADRASRPFDGLVHGASASSPSAARRWPAASCPARTARRGRSSALGRLVARVERMRVGPRGKSALLEADDVRRLQQEVRAQSHRIRLAVARPGGGRRIHRRSLVRLCRFRPSSRSTCSKRCRR